MGLWSQETANHVGSGVQKGVHVLQGALGAVEAVKGIYRLAQAAAPAAGLAAAVL